MINLLASSILATIPFASQSALVPTPALSADSTLHSAVAMVDASGLHLEGRSAYGTTWSMGMRLASWGRGSNLTSLAPGFLEGAEERSEIRHDGLVEWYQVDNGIVEQGFTVTDRPRGEAGHLHLEIEIEGDFDIEVRDELTASLVARDDSVRLLYSGLRAWDASGRELVAKIVGSENRLSLAIEDRDARYPITVDPWIWTQQTKLTPAAGGAPLRFGHSVALDGDTMLVGAPDDDVPGSHDGAVYVYERSGSSWVQQAKLTRPHVALTPDFGVNVTLHENIAVVSDFLLAVGGTAFIYQRTGTTWDYEAAVGADYDGDMLGDSLALAAHGETVVVGKRSYGYAPTGLGDWGAAFVYVRQGTAWIEQAILDDPNPMRSMFGHAVAVWCDTPTTGDCLSASWFGSRVHHYRRTGTTWSFVSELSTRGRELSMHEDEVLVGNPDPVNSTGSATICRLVGSDWIEEAVLTASDPTLDSSFGQSVSLSRDAAFVGAEGAAYVFERNGTTWTETAKLAGGIAGAEFGASVAMSEGTALVGAPLDTNGSVLSGATYVFEPIPVAHADFRNAGSNPASLTAVTNPELGGIYQCEVDLAGTTGHTSALLAAYFTPATFTLGYGQVGLVNVADPHGELLGFPTAAGPVASFAFGIPPDPVFAGLEFSTQAAHLGGVFPFLLSNALDLFVGY